MARINLDTIRKNDKDRNTVHTPVTATYTVFDTVDGEHYVQIDTYGKTTEKYLERQVSPFNLIR